MHTGCRRDVQCVCLMMYDAVSLHRPVFAITAYL